MAFPAIDGNAVLDHTKVLASDEFEGRAPGTQRRGADGGLHHRPVQEGRPEAGQSGRHVRPEGADGRHLDGPEGDARRSAAARRQQTLKWRDDFVAWTKRVADTVSVRQVRRGVRRLRRAGARVRLGRLQGRRPARARRWWCWSATRRSPIRRTRPKLDPKMFGGRAMTYYGRWTYKYEMGQKMGAAARAHRARDRAGRVPVRRRAGEDGRAVQPGRARQEHEPGGGRRLDHARPGEEAVRARPGKDFEAAKKAAAHAGVQAGAARRDGVGDAAQHHSHDRLAQRRREGRGQRPGAEGRVRDLHVALGSLRHRRAGERRQGVPRRRGQRDGHRRHDRTRPRVRGDAGRRRSARSCCSP